MKLSRGDVVLLDFPFSDASGSKVRPAVVVQSDAINVRLPSTIVALITKTVHRAEREPSQFLIVRDSPEGKAAGLHSDSAVNCANLYTVHESFIRYRIGCSTATMLAQLAGELHSRFPRTAGGLIS